MTNADDLNSIIEFDCPFVVESHEVFTQAFDVMAPEVFHSEDDDIEILSDYWEPLTGFTNQYGYHGAVLHASEQLAGGLAEHILNNDGTYVIVAVEVYPTDDDPEPAPAGWAVLRLKD